MAPAASAILRRAHYTGLHSLTGRRPHAADHGSVHLPPAQNSLPGISWQLGSRVAGSRLIWATASGSFVQERGGEDAGSTSQVVEERKGVDLLKILKSANTVIPT